MSSIQNLIVTLPPLDGAPAQVQAVAAAYETAVSNYLAADSEVLGAQGFLDNADRMDASAIAKALRTGEDPIDAAHHTRDAQEQVRVARHVVTARTADLKRAVTDLKDACTEHRDHMLARIAPEVRAAETDVVAAIHALDTVQRTYRNTIAAGVWWQEMAGRILPSYGQSPRAAEREYAGEFTVTDDTAQHAVQTAAAAGILDQAAS